MYAINKNTIPAKITTEGIHSKPKHHNQGILITPRPFKIHNINVNNTTKSLKNNFFIFQVLLDHKLFYNLH